MQKPKQSLTSLLLITLLPALSHARPNPSPNPSPRPSPVLKCPPSSPSCAWSRIGVPPPHASPTWTAAPIAIDTSILSSSVSTQTQTQISPSSSTSFSTQASPSSPISSGAQSQETTHPSTPPRQTEDSQSPPPERAQRPPPPPPPPHRPDPDTKTHRIIVVALSVSMTCLFLAFALLGFLFVHRRRHDRDSGGADERNGKTKFEKVELDSTDCFMRRVEVGSLVSSVASRSATLKSKGEGMSIHVVEENRIVEEEEKAEEKKKKWSFDRSEETLSAGLTEQRDGDGGEKKWSFDGGEEDSISPVRKEECGNWRFCRSEESLSTPSSAQTDEWEEEKGKKWSFDRSEETLAMSPRSEKRDQWKEEEERSAKLSFEIENRTGDEKMGYKLAPTKSHRSNTSRDHHDLRIEVVQAELQEADDLISPLELSSPVINLFQPITQATRVYGGEKMERVSKIDSYKRFCPREKRRQRRAERETEKESWETAELCVGSPPRQKDTGFWSMDDGVNGEMAKQRAGEDLWDLFVTM